MESCITVLVVPDFRAGDLLKCTLPYLSSIVKWGRSPIFCPDMQCNVTRCTPRGLDCRTRCEMHSPHPVYKAIRMSFPVSHWPLNFQMFFRHILQVLLVGSQKKRRLSIHRNQALWKPLHKTSSMLGSRALIVCITGWKVIICSSWAEVWKKEDLVCTAYPLHM